MPGPGSTEGLVKGVSRAQRGRSHAKHAKTLDEPRGGPDNRARDGPSLETTVTHRAFLSRGAMPATTRASPLFHTKHTCYVRDSNYLSGEEPLGLMAQATVATFVACGTGGVEPTPPRLRMAPRAEPARRLTRSVNRGQESARGTVEGEAMILPGCALTESCQSLHIAPDGPGIRLELLRQSVGVGGLIPRQLQSRRDRIEHLLARGPSSWAVARRSMARSSARLASSSVRTDSSESVHAACIDAPTCRRRKPATC
jgi:hypothetical protein